MRNSGLRDDYAIPCLSRRQSTLPPARDGLTPSAKLDAPHPVDPLGDHDLSVLAIADIAAEDTGAALPPHRLTGTPRRADPHWRRCCAPLGALAGLARLASG
jgi:hypothetical protein